MMIRLSDRALRWAVLLVTAVLCLLFVACPARAEETKVISNADQFLDYAIKSQTESTAGWNVILTSDIELSDSDMAKFTSSGLKHLSFGNSRNPFRGTFDGQGHTVTGLKYSKNAFDPERDTGFFSYTEGATIRNFRIKDADIWADFRGGILVGHAENTHIENVMIMESTLHLTAANNVLNLVTNAGTEGGQIAGELDNCTVYNCEVRGGRVVENTTEGVQAAGGEGLYCAAFAGYACGGTVIEYCRVTPTRNADGTVQAHTDVTNKYDVAVGALGGFNVYASGFVGYLGGRGDSGTSGAQLIDCFSTAKCYAYAGSYVNAVNVNRAFCGGLAGRAKATGKMTFANQIVRCHYAGDLSSRQYNPALVVPIIQNDVNLGGLVGRGGTKEVVINRSWYKPSVSLAGSSQGKAAKKELYSFGHDKTLAGVGYGPRGDGDYLNRPLWEGEGYDFAGGIMRSTQNNGKISDGNGGFVQDHVNKWVLDDKLGIPVHGQSVKATLDFPGAGEVTIDATRLGQAQSTGNPYDFAVSYVLATTVMGMDGDNLDTAVTFREQAAGEGYKFQGWYRVSDVAQNQIPEDITWFDGKSRPTAGDPLGTGETYVAKPAGDGFKDNDLFIASYKAQTRFFDAQGNRLDPDTGTSGSGKDDDWYVYQVQVTPKDPAQNVPENSVFLGWAAVDHNAGKPAGIDNIATNDLDALKNAGTFYQAGSAIAIESPKDLYPVYRKNQDIRVEIEGHGDSDATRRDGVAVVDAKDNKPTLTWLGEGGSVPDGYRFLGWYENGVRVSGDTTYQLPASVDLTQEHTYVARLEYRVDYYANMSLVDNEYQNFAQEWFTYGQQFSGEHAMAIAPSSVRREITHWSLDAKNLGECSDAGDSVPAEKTVTSAPMKVYGHWNATHTSDKDTDVVFRTDFPEGGTPRITEVDGTQSDEIGFDLVHEENGSAVSGVAPGYEFRFWACERTRTMFRSTSYERWLYGNAAVPKSYSESGHVNTTSSTHYVYEAHVVAKLTFHKKGNATGVAVSRTRGEKILHEANSITYAYPFSQEPIGTKKAKDTEANVGGSYESEASPTDESMQLAGYTFLGWISTAEVAKDSDNWNAIYNVAGDDFVTSDEQLARPYLVSESDIVTQTQELYPVYVPEGAAYHVSYTTNLQRQGYIGESYPSTDTKPSFAYEYNEDKTDKQAIVSVAPDANKTIPGSSKTFTVTKVVLEKPDGTQETKLPADAPDGSYSFTVLPGVSYSIVAYYVPVPVTYHPLNGEPVTKWAASPGTDTLGSLDGGVPTSAELPGASDLFYGWTTQKPTEGSNHVTWGESVPMVSAQTIVNNPMDLYPVYRATNIKVQSNIDTLAGGDLSFRTYDRDGNAIRLSAQALVKINGDEYDFAGWSSNYESDEHYSVFTTSQVAVLSGTSPYAGGTYTAVYTKVSSQGDYQVKYHGVDGTVLKTVYVSPESDRAKAGFVRDVTYTDDSGQVRTIQNVPYDSEAFTAIAQQLQAQNAGDGTTSHETFLGWRYGGQDWNPSALDNFTKRPIAQDMNLYPVTVRLFATDGTDGAGQGNFTSGIVWPDSVGAENASADASDNTQGSPYARVALRDGYDTTVHGKTLTIHVDKVTYSAPGEGSDQAVTADASPLDDQWIALYANGAPLDANYLDTKQTGTADMGVGNAVFTFPDTTSTHKLTINKVARGQQLAGSVTSFKVTKTKDENGNDVTSQESRTVPVGVSSAPAGDESTYAGDYTGSAALMLEPGTYEVSEESSWSWRSRLGTGISVMYSQGGSIDRTANKVTFVVEDTSILQSVTFGNGATNSQWLDASAQAVNVWNDGGVARDAASSGAPVASGSAETIPSEAASTETVPTTTEGE